MRKNSRLLLAFSIIPQIIIVKILSNFPLFVEQYYSNGLYVLLSKMMRYIFGWIPLSMGDVFYTLLVIYIAKWFISIIRSKRYNVKNILLDIGSSLSIAYFAFHMLWAYNYYRPPLHQTLELNKDYSTTQLISLTQRLIQKTNESQLELMGHDSIKVSMPYNKSELLRMVPAGFDALKDQYPHLEYSPRSIKRSIYSIPLTYMGFAGYLNPFTNEAQIDGIIPLYKYPTTASHEIAHQLGFAAENEANFIAGLAAIKHPNRYFNYSGYSFALGHCLNEVYARDPMLHEALMGTIHKGAIKNFNELYMFWMSYQNPAEPYFKSTYNRFLKVNNQSLGMESYSYVVALMVNYYEKRDL